MFARVGSYIRGLQKRREIKRDTRDCGRCAKLALCGYKLALLDLYEASGPQKRKLVLLKIKAGNIWSRRHFMAFLRRALATHSKYELKLPEALSYMDFESFRREFTWWAKKHFLR
tara:strand:- start:1654 stop:1998 length:345 start_codon:yes stop_codon:yes gene_type:complete